MDDHGRASQVYLDELQGLSENLARSAWSLKFGCIIAAGTKAFCVISVVVAGVQQEGQQ